MAEVDLRGDCFPKNCFMKHDQIWAGINQIRISDLTLYLKNYVTYFVREISISFFNTV